MLCVKCNDFGSSTQCVYHLLFCLSLGFYFTVKLQYVVVVNNVSYSSEPTIRK